MIINLAGVTIWTEHLEQMTMFYRDTLGLTMRSDHGDFVNFTLGGARLNLGLHDRVQGPSKDPYRVMVHLEVDDIHAMHQHLVAQDVKFIRQPEQESWGGWIATLSDPDGNVLQLLQLPP